MASHKVWESEEGVSLKKDGSIIYQHHDLTLNY
jgi:hypothetical protein